MAYRQFRNGGTSAVKSRTTLVVPSFADRVTRLSANIMLPSIDDRAQKPGRRILSVTGFCVKRQPELSY
jgi:hypothetical protein